MSEEEFPTSVSFENQYWVKYNHKRCTFSHYFLFRSSRNEQNDSQEGGERVWVIARLVKSSGKL